MTNHTEMTMWSDPVISTDWWAVVLWGAWVLSGLVTVSSILMMLRSSFVRYKAFLIGATLVVGRILFLLGIVATIWKVAHILAVRGVSVSGGALDSMQLLHLSQVLRDLAITLLMAGINVITAFAMNRNWRQSQYQTIN